MKSLYESLNTTDEIVVLSPDELKELLKFVKGNEKRGVCIRYQADYNNEWNQTSVCFYDERNGKGPRNWPWKTIASN